MLSFFGLKSSEKVSKTASLHDTNFNMAQMTCGHPFLEGCKELPQDKDEELRLIQEWLTTQPHIPPLTDGHVYLFLHSNYYDLEKTQDTIEAYFAIRTSSPELFSNKSYQALEYTWNMSYMFPVPQTTPEGYNVLIYRLADYEPSKMHFVDLMKAFFLFNDVRLSEDGLSPGYIVVFDMKGVCLSHMTRINFSAIRKFMNYIQEAHPARLMGVHVINSVSFMDKILALVRPLMKSGLVQLLTIHGSDLTNLFKIVPQEILPQEYGGKADAIKSLHDDHKKMVEAKYSKWIQEEEMYVMDTSKRPKQAKKQCFIQSSFKSLSID